jgi:DNA-binding protein YbaB
MAEEQQRRIEEVERERAEVQITGHSSDGLVSVTLDHTMKVAGINIDGRAMRMTSYQLVDALQEALAAAYADWRESTAELMGKAVGDPALIRDAAGGGLTAQDWFKRFGVDLDSMFRNPRGER